MSYFYTLKHDNRNFVFRVPKDHKKQLEKLIDMGWKIKACGSSKKAL